MRIICRYRAGGRRASSGGWKLPWPLGKCREREVRELYGRSRAQWGLRNHVPFPRQLLEISHGLGDRRFLRLHRSRQGQAQGVAFGEGFLTRLDRFRQGGIEVLDISHIHIEMAGKILDRGREDDGYVIELTGEAGLYVKELISGDRGRTRPSLSALIGKEARVVRLDVIQVSGTESGD